MHAYEALLSAVVVVVDADVLVDPSGELEDVDEFVADEAVVVVVREVEAHGAFVTAVYPSAYCLSDEAKQLTPCSVLDGWTPSCP